MRNSLRKVISRKWHQLFRPWWGFYYKYFNHPPRYHCKDDPWIIEHWNENPREPVCFPLPFWINCLGCRGCAAVNNPFLHPDIPKGPYKVGFHPNFIKQYEDLCGKDAVFDLLWTFQKHNLEVDKGVNMLEETEEVVEHSDQGR